MGELSKYLFSKGLLDSSRLKPHFFTRQRTLPFATVLTFLLSGLQSAVQSELDRFFANLRNRADSVRVVSARTFSQARYRIRALVFVDINHFLMALVEQHLPLPRWRGLRLVAADGSKARLTMIINDVRTIVEGVAFGLFLPGSDLFLDFVLHEPLCDERQMLFEAIEVLRRGDLLLLDRAFLADGWSACWRPAAFRSASAAIACMDSKPCTPSSPRVWRSRS